VPASPALRDEGVGVVRGAPAPPVRRPRPMSSTATRQDGHRAAGHPASPGHPAPARRAGRTARQRSRADLPVLPRSPGGPSTRRGSKESAGGGPGRPPGSAVAGGARASSLRGGPGGVDGASRPGHGDAEQGAAERVAHRLAMGRRARAASGGQAPLAVRGRCPPMAGSATGRAPGAPGCPAPPAGAAARSRRWRRSPARRSRIAGNEARGGPRVWLNSQPKKSSRARPMRLKQGRCSAGPARPRPENCELAVDVRAACSSPRWGRRRRCPEGSSTAATSGLQVGCGASATSAGFAGPGRRGWGRWRRSRARGGAGRPCSGGAARAVEGGGRRRGAPVAGGAGASRASWRKAT